MYGKHCFKYPYCTHHYFRSRQGKYSRKFNVLIPNALVGMTKNATKILVRKPKGNSYPDDLVVDDKTLLKYSLNK